MNLIEYNLAELKKEIVPCKPTIIAVTKYFGVEKLVEAYEDGLRDFGENRVQDAIEKFSGLSQEILQNSRFHLIGHLQTNKVKKAVGFFDYIHSVDSLSLAKAISENALSKNIVQKVLLQVNNANEESKYGFCVDAIKRDFGEIIQLKGLEVVGLMNIAPMTDEETLSGLFDDIRNLKLYLETEYNYELKELSMGMSNDYKIALKSGSTMIRIGRKLFT